MKKITLTLVCFMLTIACSAENEFIKVPKTNRILGNDYFSYIEKRFTSFVFLLMLIIIIVSVLLPLL